MVVQVFALVGQHARFVFHEDADDHGAEQPGHRAGTRPLVQVGTVLEDPFLNGDWKEAKRSSPTARAVSSKRMASPTMRRTNSSTSNMDTMITVSMSVRIFSSVRSPGVLGITGLHGEKPVFDQHGLQQLTLGREVVVQRGHVESGR